MRTLISPKFFASLAILLGGVLFGIATQNELFGDDFIVFAIFEVLIVIVGLATLGSAVGWLFGRRAGRFLGWVWTLAVSIALSAVLFLETAERLDRWKVVAVEDYVARAVPILDGIKDREGRYPHDLPVPVLGAPPELLRNYGDYSSDGGSFRFEYVNEPCAWAGGGELLEFTSSNRKWSEND